MGYHSSCVVRPLFIIVAAILLSRPGVSEEEATTWAEVLQREAQEHDFDPLTGVAIIATESGFQPDAISQSGEDYGLGQIRARYVGACKRDSDPLNHPSPDCKQEKARLLEAEHNIEVMADLITRNRKLCKEKTGSATLPRWLASYQGRNYPKQNKWCQPGKKTYDVIAYRSWLIAQTRDLKPPASNGAASSRE